MYIKRKKTSYKTIDRNLMDICEDLLNYNNSVTLGISKKFSLTKEDQLDKEIEGLPVIISSVPINELLIPTRFKLDENNCLSHWFDDEMIAKMTYLQMSFIDSNGYQRFYLDMDEEKLSKSKMYGIKCKKTK